MQFGGSGATSGRQGQWLLRHDEAPSHTSLVVQQFPAVRNISVVIHPQHSTDFVPGGSWLFSALRMGLKGTRFPTMEEIGSNATAELRSIPKAFRLQDRCCKSARVQGPYSEGD
jgi:hypothetical protein